MVKSVRDSLGLEKRLLSDTLGAPYSLLAKSSCVAWRQRGGGAHSQGGAQQPPHLSALLS